MQQEHRTRHHHLDVHPVPTTHTTPGPPRDNRKSLPKGQLRSGRSKAFQDSLARTHADHNKMRCIIIRDSPLERVYKVYNSNASNYHVTISCNPSCTCPDFQKNAKELCKHLIWTTRFVLGVPEESNLLQQISLTHEEVTWIFNNAATEIPQNLQYTDEFRPQQRNPIQDIL